MIKKLFIRTEMVFFLLALIFGLTSCDGLSDSGNDGVTDGFGGVDLNIQGSLPQVSSPGRAAAGSVLLSVKDGAGTEIGVLTLTVARLSIYQIELEMDVDEVDTDEEINQELEIEFTGPFIIDLISNSITPELPYIELLPGTYDEIKLKLAKIEGDELDSDGNPLIEPTDPLYGNSIYLEGTYSGDSSAGAVTDMPFFASFAVDEEFELAGADLNSTGFIIDEGVVNSIIVAYRLSRWFHFNNPETNESSTDFDLIVPESDGAGGFQITLDDLKTGDNAAIWEVIKENIKESADFGEDEDGSGDLESDEDDDPESEDDDDY